MNSKPLREKIKKQITASGNIGDDNNTEEPVVVDSLGLRAGREQC